MKIEFENGATIEIGDPKKPVRGVSYKIYGYTAEQWMFAVLDILDGDSYWNEIKYKTGLSIKRCKEIEKMFNEATKDGFPARKQE